MKKQIDQLVVLAKKYAELAIKLGLPDAHNTITGDDREIKVNVYLADRGETWSVNFGKVEVVGYTGKVEFPWHYKAQDLQDILEKATNVFENEFSLRESEYADKAKAEKAEELAKLEDRIEKLKQELNR
jgi:hypothetical protein